MWGFVLPVTLPTIFPGTLLVLAVVIFFENATCFLFGTAVGQLVDRTDRMRCESGLQIMEQNNKSAT